MKGECRKNVDAVYAPAYGGSDFASIIVLLLIVFACLVSTVRPYSQKLLFSINYVDTVMISALAVVFDSTVLDILENSPMHTSTYKFTSYIIRVTAARTGTPHIHNSCCIEESSLENKFILHRLITSCPLEVEVQRIFTRPIATPLYPVWVLLSLKLGRG